MKCYRTLLMICCCCLSLRTQASTPRQALDTPRLTLEYALQPGIFHIHNGLRAMVTPWPRLLGLGTALDYRGYAYKYGSGPGTLIFARLYFDRLLRLDGPFSIYAQVERGISGNVFGTLNHTRHRDEVLRYTTQMLGFEWRFRNHWFTTLRWGDHFGQPSNRSARPMCPDHLGQPQENPFLMPLRDSALHLGIGYDFF